MQHFSGTAAHCWQALDVYLYRDHTAGSPVLQQQNMLSSALAMQFERIYLVPELEDGSGLMKLDEVCACFSPV